ncbi:MAG TPA: phage recombination protein Bet [Kofleriaceae bacterium]|nr:phage recombination protein Bet [Kofleriaceae bacterium]
MNNEKALAIRQLGKERVMVLRNTICQGLNDHETALFLEVARAKGLDPFARQIHAVKRKDGEGGHKMTIQTGIDGFRVIAQRSGDRDGEDPVQYCGPDGKWVDIWLDEKKPPLAARARVYRRGHSRPYEGIARYDFYVQRKKGGDPNHMWGTPGGAAHMLAKCAEALALRKAYPEDLGGMYADEEMGQASNSPQPPSDATEATVIADWVFEEMERGGEQAVAETMLRSIAKAKTLAELEGLRGKLSEGKAVLAEPKIKLMYERYGAREAELTAAQARAQ